MILEFVKNNLMNYEIVKMIISKICTNYYKLEMDELYYQQVIQTQQQQHDTTFSQQIIIQKRTFRTQEQTNNNKHSKI